VAVAENGACSCRGALVGVAIFLAAGALAGCGGAATGAQPVGPSRERAAIGVDGVSIELPGGWDGYAMRNADGTVTIWAANTAFAEVSARPEYPHRTLASLPEDAVAVEIVTQPGGIDPAAFPPLSPPIRLADGYFLSDAFEGQPAPHVSSQIVHARLADTALYVQVYFGRNEPGEELRALANEVLATLTVAGGV
jgi:hypothetical protein